MVGVTWATSPAHFSLISCVSALCFHLCGGYEGSLLKNTCTMMYSSGMTEVEVFFSLMALCFGNEEAEGSVIRITSSPWFLLHL